MEYHTAYFWQDSEENNSSLTLQQVYHKKKQLPVVFACVGWAAEGLTDWFYAGGLNLCIRKGEDGIYSVGHRLYRKLKACLRNRKEKNQKNLPEENHAMSGILGVGRRMCIFSVGEASVRVLNLRNGRVHCKELHLLERDGQGVGIQYVTMDKGVGVLLETEGFRQRISAEQLQECLKGKTWADKDSLGNSLQELVEQMGADDGGYMGAVLLVTK